MSVVDRLETLCADEQHDLARTLAASIVQNDTVIDVDLSGAAVDEPGATVIHVETEYFHGRHVLADRAETGTNWPGRYTLKQSATVDKFTFNTATMPPTAEQLVEDHYDIEARRTGLSERTSTEPDAEASVDD